MNVAAETSWAGSSAKDVLHESVHKKHKVSLENQVTAQFRLDPTLNFQYLSPFFPTFKLQNLKPLYSIESHKHKTNLVLNGAESVPAKRHCPL